MIIKDKPAQKQHLMKVLAYSQDPQEIEPKTQLGQVFDRDPSIRAKLFERREDDREITLKRRITTASGILDLKQHPGLIDHGYSLIESRIQMSELRQSNQFKCLNENTLVIKEMLGLKGENKDGSLGGVSINLVSIIDVDTQVKRPLFTLLKQANILTGDNAKTTTLIISRHNERVLGLALPHLKLSKLINDNLCTLSLVKGETKILRINPQKPYEEVKRLREFVMAVFSENIWFDYFRQVDVRKLPDLV